MKDKSKVNRQISFNYLATLTPYTAENKRFVKVFAIEPDTVNANHWGVTREAVSRALNNLLGKPLLGPPEIGHQSRRQVGHFVNYAWNSTLYGIAEITDPDAWQKIQSGEWRYVSPQVQATTTRIQDGAEILEDFTWEHVAFVEDPAFGLHAQVRGTCEGVERPQLCTFAANLSHELRGRKTTEEKTGQEYPWDQSIQDRLNDGYTEEQARRICAAIKNRTVNRGAELGLWSTPEEGVQFIAKKASEDPLYAYTLDRLALIPEEFFEGETSQSLNRDLDMRIINPAARLGNPSEVREPPSKQGANMIDPCAEKTSQLEAELKTLKAENEALKAELAPLKAKVAAIEEAKHLAAVNDVVDLRIKVGLVDEKDHGAEIERLRKFNSEALASMTTDLNAVLKRAEAFAGPKARYTAEQAKTLEDQIRTQILGTVKHLWERD